MGYGVAVGAASSYPCNLDQQWLQLPQMQSQLSVGGEVGVATNACKRLYHAVTWAEKAVQQL